MPQCSLCTIYNSQDMEAAQVSTNGGVDVEGVVRIHGGILLSHKSRRLSPAETELDPEMVIQNEVNQKNKYCILTRIIQFSRSFVSDSL